MHRRWTIWSLRFFALLWWVVLAPLSTPAHGEDLRGLIRNRVEQLSSTGELSIGEIPIASRKVLPEFYRSRDFSPAWSNPRAMESLVRAIRASSEDGLDPRDYHFLPIQSLLKQQQLSATQRVDLDILTTDAVIRLGYHLLFGKVDPEQLDPDWNMTRKGPNFQPSALLNQAIDSGRVYEALEELKPKHPFYLRLKQALAKYRKTQAMGGSEPPQVGSVRKDDKITNVPVQQQIDQIRVNLERARWVLHDVGDRLVLVNIAGFELYLAEGGKRQWETRVQVGKPYRKTPIFKSEIRSIVFNPTWSVPPTVLASDILPAIKRNPSYLKTHKMRVIDRDGNVVNPARVKWSSYTAKNFPYRIEQEAGPENALGRVKFMFPNCYSVYLHDTPKKDLFGKSSRAFSSGCIRVENPLRLAELLLDDPGRWKRTPIDQTVASGKTVTVQIRKPLPVLLLYWTVTAGPDGQVEFLPDIYDRDPAVLKALNGRFTLRKRPVLTTSR